MRILAIISDVAQIISLLGIFWAVGIFLYSNNEAHKRAIQHIEAHVLKIRTWARGKEGMGWLEKDISIKDQIGWCDPRNTVFLIESSVPLNSITFSSALQIKRMRLKKAVVGLSQSIANLNSFINKIYALQVADPIISASISEKLTIYQSAHINVDRKNINDVFAEANLTTDELRIADLIGSMSRALHLSIIGTKIVPGSVNQWLNEVEIELEKEKKSFWVRLMSSLNTK